MNCITYAKKCVIRGKRGTSTVFFALVLTMIATFAALTIDVGFTVIEKSKLSSAVDSAALAGAQELMTNTDNVRNIVDNYLLKNAGTLKEVIVSIEPGARIIEVKGVKQVNSFFGKIAGINAVDITATAKVKVENIKSLKGARSIAVVQQTFAYGNLYTLKEGGGGGNTGNYAAMALGGSGASVYRNNLMYGYDGIISVGDQIATETGNIAGATETSINYLIQQCNHTPLCTYQSYNKRCPRIIFAPVVNTLDINGKKYVKVLGFATFFLESVIDQSGQAEIMGRFITYSMQGETSSDINDYGTYGIRLVN